MVKTKKAKKQLHKHYRLLEKTRMETWVQTKLPMSRLLKCHHSRLLARDLTIKALPRRAVILSCSHSHPTSSPWESPWLRIPTVLSFLFSLNTSTPILKYVLSKTQRKITLNQRLVPSNSKLCRSSSRDSKFNLILVMTFSFKGTLRSTDCTWRILS